jgi:arylsulfatase A-like enzyme
MLSYKSCAVHCRLLIIIFLALGIFSCQKEVGTIDTDKDLSGTLNSEPLPNIVFILVDDLGYGDVGYLGSEIKTPNLDQLAANGMVIQHNYAYPICSPTRAALMTGKNPIGFGIDGPMENDAMLPADIKLLPEYLQDAGYQTWMVGKWHLGMGLKKAMPHNRGFDDFYGSLGGFTDFYTHVYFGGLDWQHNGVSIREEGHVTDLLTARALRKIEGFNNDKPFFMYLSYTAPHTPLQKVPAPIYDYSSIASADRRVFADMTSHLDQGIGQVIAAIEAKGIADNTLIIFMSDNGGNEIAGADNGILTGEKASAYEGGVRVPAFVYWPSKIAGKQSLVGPIFTQDWLPTLLDVVNVNIDDMQFEGQSVWPSVMSPDVDIVTKNIVVGTARSKAVYNWPWKLIVEDNTVHKLFNVQDDPTEKNNLYTQHPDKVSDMLVALSAIPKLESKAAKGPKPESLFVDENGNFDHDVRKPETREAWAESAN